MTISVIPGATSEFLYPGIPFTPFRYNNAPSVVANNSFGSASATWKASHAGEVLWADKGTHDIRKITGLIGAVAVGSGATFRVSLQDVDATQTPLIPDGTADQSVTFDPSTLTANAANQHTLSSDRTSVAHGTLLCVVYDMPVAGSGASVAFNSLSNANNFFYASGASKYSGSWTLVSNTAANILLEASDGTRGCIGTPFASAVNTHVFNSGSTPSRYALAVTPWIDVEVIGMAAQFSPAAGCDLDFVLYNSGGTSLRSVSIDNDSLWPSSAGYRVLARRFSSPITLTAGNLYYASVNPTTGNNITLVSVDVPAAADLGTFPGGTAGQYSTYSGSWAAATATRRPAIALIVNGLDTGGGSSGVPMIGKNSQLLRAA